MGGNPLILQIIGGLLVILFIVTIIFSVKAWRAVHVVALVFVFGATMFFVACASMTLKTHTSWRGQHHQLESELQAETRSVETLAYGDPDEGGLDSQSVRNLTARVSRLLLDRGRVWRYCTPGNFQGGQLTVSTTPPGIDEANAQANGIDVGSILYAFREDELPALGIRVPSDYLGEYEVTAATDTTVTIKPTLPLDAMQQRQTAVRNNTTWSLYEMMPLDDHRVFADQDTVALRLNNEPDQAIFGEFNAELLQNLFAATVRYTGMTPELQQQVVQKLVNQYMRDGRPANEADDEEDVWHKVEFLRNHKVTVDSETLAAALTGGYFDPEGRAVAPRLQRGSEAEFEENQIGVFPKAYVDSVLIPNNIARDLGPLWVRPLNDYEYLFHSIHRRIVARNEDIRRAERDIKSLQAARDRAREQITYRQDEKVKLETDLEKTNAELAALTALAEAIDKQREDLVAEMSQLHQTNLLISQQLAEIQDRLAAEIDRRTAAAR